MNETILIILIFISGVILIVGLFILFALPLLGTVGGLGLFINKQVKQAKVKNVESLS